MSGSNDDLVRIGIDYDGTITRLRPVIFAIVQVLKSADGQPYEMAIVTARSHDTKLLDNAELYKVARSLNLPVYFCAGRAKELAYPADIWIENEPEGVREPSKLIGQAINMLSTYGNHRDAKDSVQGMMLANNHGVINLESGREYDEYKPVIWNPFEDQ